MQVVWLQRMFALLKAYHVEQQNGDFDGLAPDFRICTITDTAHKFHQGFQLEPPPSPFADPKLGYEGFQKLQSSRNIPPSSLGGDRVTKSQQHAWHVHFPPLGQPQNSV